MLWTPLAKQPVWPRLLWVASLFLVPTQGHPQQAAPPTSGAATQAAPSAPAPLMEQPALDQLQRMSNALRSARALTYRSRSSVEVPAKTGQFVTLFGTTDVAQARPNKLRVRVTGEVPAYDLYYDGATVVAFAPQDHVYSVVKAPDTIDDMLPFLEEKTGIQFAAADIMFSDPYAALTKGLTGAFVVGPASGGSGSYEGARGGSGQWTAGTGGSFSGYRGGSGSWTAGSGAPRRGPTVAPPRSAGAPARGAT